MTNSIHNLRKRAKALGLVVTKAWDASVTGYSEYVLHEPGEAWEHLPMISLVGIQRTIEIMEQVRD